MRALVRPIARVAILALSIGVARAEAPAWEIDAENSSIELTARQMQVPVPAHFARFAGEIRFSPDQLEASSVRIAVSMDSIQTPNADIETEIKREPWLNVAQFPTALFQSQTIVHAGENRYELAGDLTVRGVTRPVVLQAEIEIGQDPGRPAGLVAKATGSLAVSRLDFSIGQGQWADTAIVAGEVAIRFAIVARRQTGERPAAE